MLLQQTGPQNKDEEKLSTLKEYHKNPHMSTGEDSPTSNMTAASLETEKYREMCKFYCSPYNVTTKNNHPTANVTWRYGRKINHVGRLKPLQKVVKFKDENDEIHPDYSGDYENMEAGEAVNKWTDKKFSKQLPKATPVTNFRYTNGSVEGRNERDDDVTSSYTSDTLRSTPTDSSTSETNQDSDSLSTKSKKCKKKVQFVGLDNRGKNGLSRATKGKKSKAQRPLQASKPYAYIKDEKTGKLPVIYEEKGVLPPIVEKYTKNVIIKPTSHPRTAGNKHQMVVKRWRSVYDKIRPTNHMKTFTEVVYAVKAKMEELKAAEKYEDEVDGDLETEKPETVKIVKTSIMQTPTVQRMNANGVKLYPIDSDHGVAAKCT